MHFQAANKHCFKIQVAQKIDHMSKTSPYDTWPNILLPRTFTINCLVVKTSLTLKVCYKVRFPIITELKIPCHPTTAQQKSHHCEDTGTENLLQSRRAEVDTTDYGITII